MDDHSENTITEAIKIWEKTHIPSFHFSNIEKTKPLTTRGSKTQTYLDGCSYLPDGNKDYIPGHLTLSPIGQLGYVQSAHLTLTGGSKWVGNYFFTVNDVSVTPSDAPKKYKGKDSYNGDKLPQNLRSDVVQLFMYVLNNVRL